MRGVTYVAVAEPSVKGRLSAETDRRGKPRFGQVVDDWDEEKVIYIGTAHDTGGKSDQNRTIEWYWYRFNPEEARNCGKAQSFAPLTIGGGGGSTCSPPPTTAFYPGSPPPSYINNPRFQLEIWFDPAFPDVTFYNSAALHALCVNAALNLKQTKVKPALPQVEVTRSTVTAVSLGSKIYAFTGCYHWEYLGFRKRFPYDRPISDLIYIDTLQPEKGWRETTPRMVCPRSGPAVIAVDGKIYAFGGGISSRTTEEQPGYCCFGEVFDPILERWESIPEPPFTAKRHSMIPLGVSPSLAAIAGLHGVRKGILIHIPENGRLYVYHVDSRRWEVFQYNFSRDPCHFAAVNGVLFCFSAEESAILGYDLISKTWKPVEFPPGDFPTVWGKPGKGDPLFHLGKGNLCFLWQEILTDPGECHSVKLVRYIRFTTEDDGTRFLGTVTHLGSLALEMPPSTRTLN